MEQVSQLGVVFFAALATGGLIPIQLMLGRLDAPKQAALLHDLEQFWIDNNLATNGENHTLISNEYLMAHAVNRTTRC